MISAEILGVDKLVSTLGKTGQIFTRRLLMGMQVAASNLRNYIANSKINGQVLQSRTGNLRKFLFWKASATGDKVEGQVDETMKYGKVHEYGMTIVPLRAKALRWVGADGKLRFAKSVTIPARPWMKPGYEEQRPKTVETLTEAARLACRDMAAEGTGT